MENSPVHPTTQMIAGWKQIALKYLQAQFGKDAPSELSVPTVFPWSPLESEGAVAVFEFFAGRGQTAPERFLVCAGETEPNYYPAAALSFEEGYELHLGTRFMLVLGVSQVPTADALHDITYDMQLDVERIVRRASGPAMIKDIQLAAMFAVDNERHAVIRCRVAGQLVYVMGRDAPAGFSTRTDLSPHVAYRLHIGHVLRREIKSVDERRSSE